MPCPFPGMDPFIEGQRWPDFHLTFINEVRVALVPHLRPNYDAVIEERVYVERYPSEEISFIQPDVSVVELSPRPASGGVATITPPVMMPIAMPERMREGYIEIRTHSSGELVTVIEVLSPANKRSGSDGQREYLAKRSTVLSSTVHLVELDLLRGGHRMPMAQPLPPADYIAVASPAQRRLRSLVWPFTVRSRMPVIGVPLAGGDPDVPLDLQAVFTSVYDRAGYDYTLRYGQDVVPPLAPADAEWVRNTLSAT